MLCYVFTLLCCPNVCVCMFVLFYSLFVILFLAWQNVFVLTFRIFAYRGSHTCTASLHLPRSIFFLTSFFHSRTFSMHFTEWTVCTLRANKMHCVQVKTPFGEYTTWFYETMTAVTLLKTRSKNRLGVFKLIFWQPNAICDAQYSVFNMIFIKRAFLQLDEINSKEEYLVSSYFLFFISLFLYVSSAKCQKNSTPSSNEWMNKKKDLDWQTTQSVE